MNLNPNYRTVYLDAKESHSKGVLTICTYTEPEIEQEQISLDELGIYAENYISKLTSEGWRLCAVEVHSLYKRTYHLQRFKGE